MHVDEKLRDEVRAGLLEVDRLLDLFLATQKELPVRITELESPCAALEKENAELRSQAGHATPAKIDQPYSLEAEEKRQQQRGTRPRKESKKRRRGRLANEAKRQRAEAVRAVVPEGLAQDQCRFSHVRLVWRLEDGRAKLIAYRSYRGSRKQYGVIPGVLGRSELGLELVITLAYLIQVIGLSFDKACLVMNFLQQVQLSKSQADALLHQLARHWAEEFEVLCTLLANSAVVHADETSWSSNPCSPL